MTDAERPPLRVGIIGSGNIGTDLMLKIARSPVLELAGMAGIDPESDGLARAARQGYWTTSRWTRRAAREASRTSTSSSMRPRPSAHRRRTPSCSPSAASNRST